MVLVNEAEKALLIVKRWVQSPIASSDASILSTDRLLWVTGCCWLPLHFARYPASLNGLGWLERHWNVGWCSGQRCRSHLCCVRTQKLAISLVVMSPSFPGFNKRLAQPLQTLKSCQSRPIPESPTRVLPEMRCDQPRWAVLFCLTNGSPWTLSLLLFCFLIRFPLLFCH